jgi:hypothetical protein
MGDDACAVTRVRPVALGGLMGGSITGKAFSLKALFEKVVLPDRLLPA